MNRIRRLLLASFFPALLGFDAAMANPVGPQVVAGHATAHGVGTPDVTVTQTTSKAILNWNTFDIGAGERTRFVQPGASSVALNRVTGGFGPSQLNGELTANGRIFLVNPDGILIGPGGRIDTAGFLATTHDIGNDDFMAGRFQFTIPGRPDASVVNEGAITAMGQGFAALVAPGVRNSGTIVATLGRVGLAAGNGFTLDLYGDRLIQLVISDSIASEVRDVSTGQALASLVANRGEISAGGGLVELSAATARRAVDSVINNSGVIEADSFDRKDGLIVLNGAAASTKLAGAPVQEVKLSGTLSAAGREEGASGGVVLVTGEAIELTSATIDVSGRAGGGTVLIGGDVGGGRPSAVASTNSKAMPHSQVISTASTVAIDEASAIDASAKLSGDGGKVVVWADGTTDFAGSIEARGGASRGDGGFVEVSGHQQLAFAGSVDAGASNGKSGTLLLDPQDITIGNTGTWIVTPSALTAALASNDVFIVTNAALPGSGDIFVAEGIIWNSANTLTLTAHRNIVFNNGVTVANTGGGSLNLGAGITHPVVAPGYGNGLGTILFNGNGKVDFSGSTGFVDFGYNPVGGYTNPTNFSARVLTNPLVPGQFGAYMWVNNLHDLNNIRQNLSGNYAIANRIDASATAGWNGGAGFIPIGDWFNPFSGSLIGIGGNLPLVEYRATIENLTIISAAEFVGLFGVLSDTAFLRGIDLINAHVVGTRAGDAVVGALAGMNSGIVAESSATGGTVLGTSSPAGYAATGGLVGVNDFIGTIFASNTNLAVFGFKGEAGGLAGRNLGVIAESAARGSLTLSGASAEFGGGLAGVNDGTILMSEATGSVSVTSGSPGAIAGGFLGMNFGTVSHSRAAGSVSLNGFGGYAGGFVGYNALTGIVNSYATGVVNGGVAGSERLGGFAGWNEATIAWSYAAGQVSGGGAGVARGGFVGEEAGLVLQSYWDMQNTGQASGAGLGVTGATGLTTAQLKSAALPAGFSDTVWRAGNGNYPSLLWQGAMPLTPTPATLLQAVAGPAVKSTVSESSAQLTGQEKDLSKIELPSGKTVTTVFPPTADASHAEMREQLHQVLSLIPGLSSYTIRTLIENAVFSAFESALVESVAREQLFQIFLSNLRAQNTLTGETGINFVEAVISDAVAMSIEAWTKSQGWSEYLIRPTIFAARLAVANGFAQVNPKYGPGVATLIATSRTTTMQLVETAQAGVGLWTDIQSLRDDFARLEFGADELHARAIEKRNEGDVSGSIALFRLELDTRNAISDLRQQYTVGGVSILDNSGAWNFLSIFAR
ncbi:filamentous hemagglutinin N-terminal domain-containing protein [Parvibaculum sp.]|uniref:two-partner secretion domain-containing protein n=1 Tax=Parvibaculum sp. TaxID=2024848 RepID=UPI001DB2D620|nr:filamentous hemagglutinin N-terminal domain-containing protein [Parvibaculum sp.]MBX3490636.1 filamentous hemagglutinin N-terminal domain-containing protein [Parvibaculum sp.]MCW5728540.1 filamentous hemagglutinin N-terminal domain-containing protein [Parvibaculum sp.]